MAQPRPVTVPVTGRPTAVVGTADGRWAFASVPAGGVPAGGVPAGGVPAGGVPAGGVPAGGVPAGGVPAGVGGGIAVLALGRGAPRLVRTVALPSSMTGSYGLAMTQDGLLLVAGYTATAVLSIPALEQGGRDPLVGVLADAGAGQFEVALSGDDRYVFVSDETTGGLSVFDLATALRRGFSAPGVAVGIVPLATGVVGVALSPDGARLYVVTYGKYGPYGQLWVLDKARAETGAGRGAVLEHVAAGCQPVRVAVSPDGRTVNSGTVEEFPVPAAP
jgi:hypothetical protein